MRKPPPEIFPEAVFYEIVSVFPSLRKVLVPSTVRNVSMFLSLRAFNSSSSAGSLSEQVTTTYSGETLSSNSSVVER